MFVSDSQGTYVESFVAFLDVLGFKQIVKNNDYNWINDFFNDVSNFSNLLLKNPNNIFTKEMLDTVTVNIISDSIVISVPITTKCSLEILLLVINTIAFNVLREYRILLRGGIVEGKFCSKGVIAFGPALVDAYNIENTISIYPRIVFTRSVYTSYAKLCSPEDLLNLNDLMRLDISEELFFADYIGFSIRRIGVDVLNNRIPIVYAEKLFWSITNFIEDEIATCTDKHVREKLLYFNDYYNNCVEMIKSEHILPFKCNLIFGGDLYHKYEEIIG